MARFFSRGGADTAGAAVPKAWRRALESAVSGLDRGHPHLPGAIRDYVLTGSPASAVAEVGQCSDAPRELALGGPWYGGRDTSAVRTLYALAHEVPADVVLRWGRVGEAALVTNRWLMSLPAVAGGHWAEALLLQMSTVHLQGGDPRRPQPVPLSHEVLERVVEAAGAEPWELLAAAFRDGGPTEGRRSREVLARMPGYSEAVARHADELRPVVAAPGAAGRKVAASMLADVEDDVLRLFTAEVADYATGTSKEVRQAGQQLARRCGDDLVEPLRQLAVDAKPEQRLAAFRMLWSLADDDESRAWARKHAEADRAPSVTALLEEWDRAEQAPQEPAPALEQPALPEVDWRVPTTPELRDLLATVWDQANRAIAAHNVQQARFADDYQARHGQRPEWVRAVPLLDPKRVEKLLADLGQGRPPKAVRDVRVNYQLVDVLVRHLLGNPLLTPVVVLHLLAEAGWLLSHGDRRLSGRAVQALTATHERGDGPTLLELEAMLADLGVDGAATVLASYCSDWGDVLGRDWPAADVAPFMARHVDALLAIATSTETDYSVDKVAAFRGLATLPALPPEVVETLIDVALTGPRAHRRAAQEALRTVPGLEPRVVSALADGKMDVRAEAAGWLARLGHADAVPALEAAVAKERQDVTKGALVDALQRLGQPAAKYLDRDGLAASAEAAVAKGLPKDLDWFPWAGVPEVRWADGTGVVPPVVVQWLVAQAVKAKSPEPNALLRQYCALLEDGDRERLGQYLLEVWLAQDVLPIDPDEAHERARQQAQSLHAGMQQHPQWYQESPWLGKGVEEITAGFLPALLREPRGSATSSKGLLAVVAACAGEGVAAPVERYLREWYGHRPSQGKALIAMLAWVEHPSATQLMLSVGSRFRTKSFQEEANRQAEALAERRGWSVVELADRTIPTAGLDPHGVLELPYGERVFTAVLQPDLGLELRSPEGAAVSGLPTPRRTDDEDRAKESKKALASARKEVKAVAKLQAARLYEALCTGRDWAFDDWRRYLLLHPVVRHLVQRLVWVATDTDGTVLAVFRPLDDGTLTDADDAEVEVPADARVRLAHDSVLTPAAVREWQQHLADYEVTPLFPQLGRGDLAAPADLGLESEVTDVRGCLVESFTLRGRANRLGYTRGSAEDGGWFLAYEKAFPTLGITTVVGFSGNSLPEESRTVALTALTFRRDTPGGSGSAMLLRDVPPVLLSEARHDLQVLAGGATPDPDWEKKVGW